MNPTKFSLFFEGQALKEKPIGARDLAEILLAADNLFEDANQQLFSSDYYVSLSFQTTEAKSLEIFLEALQSFYQDSVNILAGKDVAAMRNLVEILFGSTGLVWLVKKISSGLRNTKEDLTQEDRDSLSNHDDRIILLQSPQVTTSLENLVYQPMMKMELDTFEARKKGTPMITVRSDEVWMFSKASLDSLAQEISRWNVSIQHPNDENDDRPTPGSSSNDLAP